MVDRIWLKNYPEGIPPQVDLERYISLGDLFDDIVDKFRTKPALHNLGCTMSYEDLARHSRDFAAFLQALPGLAKGERIAIMSPNLLQYPVALYSVRWVRAAGKASEGQRDIREWRFRYGSKTSHRSSLRKSTSKPSKGWCNSVGSSVRKPTLARRSRSRAPSVG